MNDPITKQIYSIQMALVNQLNRVFVKHKITSLMILPNPNREKGNYLLTWYENDKHTKMYLNIFHAAKTKNSLSYSFVFYGVKLQIKIYPNDPHVNRVQMFADTYIICMHSIKNGSVYRLTGYLPFGKSINKIRFIQ